jgi:nicotinate-nucleotide adenylyltransferase
LNAVGVLGGTFDPIHLGHLITAQAIIELRSLEKVIFVPCNISPHKTEVKHSEPIHRLKMTELAIMSNPAFSCSSIDIKRGGISYMIDTLRELKNKFDNLELIIGYDNIEKFYTWKDPDEILKVSKLIVMKRSVEKEIITKDKYYEAATFVNTPTIDIKATAIRQRVKNKLPIDFLVTENVREYIYQNDLYKD